MSSVSIATVGRLALLVLVMVAAGGCGDARVSQANYEKIQNGMSLQQIQDILGPGAKESQGDGSNVAGQFGVDVQGYGGQSRGPSGDVYTWESGARKITVYFDSTGKVANKQAKGF
jgi:hypothetical protein